MNKPRPKIVMIASPIHPVPPKHGAAVEWWMFQTARRLKTYEPHIISIGADGYAAEEELSGVHFHRIFIGRLYKRVFQKLTRLDPWSYAHRAAQIVKRLAPELIHVHNAPQLYSDLARMLRHAGPRLILHMHNEKQFPPLEAGAPLFVVSRYLEGWYAQRHPQAIIRVITNGADIGRIRPVWEGVEVSELRRRLGIPPGKMVILFVGRMSPEKGPLDLVLAFRELFAQRQDVFLLLVGEFSKRRGTRPNDRAAYGEQIRAECQKMAGFCHYTGSVNPVSIQDYYYAGDLVVIPSEFEEPLCMVAIEAMAAGIPVLASRKGGLPELIEDGTTGFFIEAPKSPSRLAAQIDGLLSQPDALRQIASRARRQAENRHDWSEVARQTEEAFTRIRSNHT